MNKQEIEKCFASLNDKNNKTRFAAFKELNSITEKKVNWIYERWFELIEKTESENSYQRTIGLTLLANLCKSDDENRFLKIIDKYIEHFDDEKFITARLCIQVVWKIAVAKEKLSKKIISALENAYWENIHLKDHANLIRQDIIGNLDQIYSKTKDKTVIKIARKLAKEETDKKTIKLLDVFIKKTQ
jgi:hypothetical protein